MQLLPSRGSTISQCTYSHCKSPPRCTTSTRTAACAASQGAAAPPATISAQLSVYAVSDLHCDYSSNLQWVCSLPVRKQQSSTTHANDQQQLQRPAANDQQQLQVSCCIVPGDISDDLRIIRETLLTLQSKFDLVAFTCGANHELWVKSETEPPPSPQRPRQQQSYLHSDTGQGGNSNNGSNGSSTRSSEEACEAAAGSASLTRNGGAVDSIQKLHKVCDLCDELGVIRQPVLLGGLLLVPLLSWHHQSFDREADIPGVPRAGGMTIADYSACKWPAEGFPGSHKLGSEATAAWFDAANESELQQPGWSMLQQLLISSQGSSSSGGAGGGGGGSNGNGSASAASSSSGGGGSSSNSNSSISQHLNQKLDTITFSHFLPHQHLLPEKRMLTYPNLAKAVGSDFLWSRLQQIQPHLHIFGHSHFAWDAELEGIRFLQAPLCYPAERQHRLRSIRLNTEQEMQQEMLLMQQKQQQDDDAGGGDAGRQEQQTYRVSVPGHSSSSSADAGRVKQHGSGRHKPAQQPAQQQQQQQQQGSLAGSLPWLPVKVYQADFTAELMHTQHQVVSQQQQQQQQLDVFHQQPLSGCVLSVLGVPVLHSHHLHMWQQQQQQQQQRIIHHQSEDHQQQSHQQHPHKQQQQQQQPESGGGPQAVYTISSWRTTWGQPLHGLWSEYYKQNARDPNNVELAPWVAKRYKRARKVVAAATATANQTTAAAATGSSAM